MKYLAVLKKKKENVTITRIIIVRLSNFFLRRYGLFPNSHVTTLFYF